MNETLDLLATRRSVSPIQLGGDPVDDASLEALLTRAARVPDHGKLAPWRFIIFEGEGRHEAGAIVADVYAAEHPEADADRLAVERNRLARAPLAVAVVSAAAPHVKIPEWEQVLSAGAVCMNLVIAANAMGFATSWLTEWFAYDRRVLDRFGLAPHEKIAGFVHIGRPGLIPTDRPRPDLGAITTRFRA